jgi:hypothetical protein
MPGSRYTENPVVGSPEWRERVLCNAVLEQSQSIRQAAKLLGMAADTLRRWERLGRTMYMPRVGDQADPMPPSQYGRERRVIACGIHAFQGDLPAVASALDWDIETLRERMAFYGLRVGARQ